MVSMSSLRTRVVLAVLVGIALVFGSDALSIGQVTITVGAGPDCDSSTIQEGIDAAQDGDVVLVAAGEYVTTEPVTFRGKAITVRSEGGPDETIIRMGVPEDSKRGSVLIFENSETSASVLEGFTLTSGKGCWSTDPSMPAASGLGGGGIAMVGSSPTIIACIITKNTADSGGGVNPAYGSAATMIDCVVSENSVPGSGGGISCWDNSSLTMKDCVVQGNSAPGTVSGVSGNGGGIFCGRKSKLNLVNCSISENSAGINGGGMMCWGNSVMTMTGCEVIGNTSQRWSGGIGSEACSLALTNCLIAKNIAGSYCGGIQTSYGDSSLNIRNCTIVENSAGQDGGGVYCWGGGASLTVTNSIFWDNTAPRGKGVFLQTNSSTLTITYSDFADGKSAVYGGDSQIEWGEGNINTDPGFVSQGYWDSSGTRHDTSDDIWVEADYHLKSQAGRWDQNENAWVQDDVTSPCIDAGDPMSPIGHELFPNGGYINVGAYGGTPEASKAYFGGPVCETIVAGDINGDGQVDRTDLEIMALHWTDEEPLLP